MKLFFLEQYFSVSRQAILNRLVNEKELKPSLAESMKTNVILYSKSLGYSSELYLPLPQEKQYGTYGHLIKQINKAFNNNLISEGKYEELLLQSFRSDLVYGDNIEEVDIFD